MGVAHTIFISSMNKLTYIKNDFLDRHFPNTKFISIGSSSLGLYFIMLMLQNSPEICAFASLGKNIPNEMIIIQDKLQSFLQRPKIMFTDRADELAVGMEVFCKDASQTYRNGIIRYIGATQQHDQFILINVELYHAHPSFKASSSSIILKPASVFQIFQSTVKTFDVSKGYGFLTFKNSKSFFFHASHVNWNSFPHSRIQEGQVVKHTIKYSWNQPVPCMNIIADNVFAVSS